MDVDALKNRLKAKPDLTILVHEAITEPAMIDGLLEIIATDSSSIKFICTKLIRLVSETDPILVYPHFDAVAHMIRQPNSFIKWDGITILANLLAIDSGHRFSSVQQDYFNLLQDRQMLTAANVVGNAWKIVKARPDLEPELTRRLLAVPDTVYFDKGEPSPECNRVICGHLLDCFDRYFDRSGNQAAILDFARSQLTNSRPAVAKKAASFLQKHTGAN